MRPLRAALLRASTSTWLAERLPRQPFARRAVARFMPGERLEDALDAARRLGAAGFPTVITQLGENVAATGAVLGVAEHYERALEQIAEAALDCQLSVKPTQLGLDLDSELCREQLERLAGAAAARHNRLWIDMEGSAYTAPTLALFRQLRTGFANVGLCLQANLRRTSPDLAQLLPLAPSIRLVKGAYAEPEERAFGRKRDVDTAYLALAGLLLRQDFAPDQVVAVATHDLRMIRRVTAAAEALGQTRDAFEVQMLYGIRVAEQHQLRREGYRVRVLVSYGTHWFPWYMRRLAERPANVWFVARSVVAR